MRPGSFLRHGAQDHTRGPHARRTDSHGKACGVDAARQAQSCHLLTHRFTGFDKLEEALTLMHEKPSDRIKIIVIMK